MAHLEESPQTTNAVISDGFGSITTQDWRQKLKELFAQQENLVLKLHLEFKKVGKVESIIFTIKNDIDNLVTKVSKIAHREGLFSRKEREYSEQEDFQVLLK